MPTLRSRRCCNDLWPCGICTESRGGLRRFFVTRTECQSAGQQTNNGDSDATRGSQYDRPAHCKWCELACGPGPDQTLAEQSASRTAGQMSRGACGHRSDNALNASLAISVVSAQAIATWPTMTAPVQKIMRVFMHPARPGCGRCDRRCLPLSELSKCRKKTRAGDGAGPRNSQ